MDSAERNALVLRRRLFSADRFKDAAIRLGSRDVKTPLSGVSESLCWVPGRARRRPARALRDEPLWRARAFRPALLLLALLAVAFLAIASPCRNMPRAPSTRRLRPCSAAA